MAQPITKIYVVNNAGFVLNFEIRWSDGKGHWFTVDWNSGNYPINQTRETPDLGTLGVPNNAPVNVKVHAVAGKENDGDESVTYVAGSTGTATYTVAGTTLHYSVHLND
ncbi:hypothetical protein AAIH70_10045 [Neorhizobium sp. BT27B]|uniref:hypothetical protein n=1 Tax=Neorhizobium sp. BT27B TaxID=3142625 RepID=UPI003D2C1682